MLLKCYTQYANKFGKLSSLSYELESYDQPRQRIKKQRHYFVNKGLSSQGYGFSKFVGILCATLLQHHLLQFEIGQLEFHHLH